MVSVQNKEAMLYTEGIGDEAIGNGVGACLELSKKFSTIIGFLSINKLYSTYALTGKAPF